MIQIDMPMPENCVECRFGQGEYGFCYAMPPNFCGYVNDFEKDGRTKWCPLHAQEPRVVKISELTAGEPMLVWLEDIDKKETVAGMIFDYVPGRLGFKLTDLACMDRIYPRIEDYLTRWRCWTSRPDEATREATPWA